ncbi:tyrosine-type recombinase/integrase [Algoriphagus namhaensis]
MPYLFEIFRQLIETRPDKTGLAESLQTETQSIIATIDQELFEAQTKEQAQFYIQKVEIALARYKSRINELIHCNDSISRDRHLNLCLKSLDKIRHHVEITYYPYQNPASIISRRTISDMAKPIAAQQAVDLLGYPKAKEEKIFKGLKYSAWTNLKLSEWVMQAGIIKKITFHCFRHTYPTLQLSLGTDIYTVSKLLNHKNVKTTQIYAKVIDQKRKEAAERIPDLGLKPGGMRIA